MGRRVLTTLLAVAVSALLLWWLLSDAVIEALAGGLRRASAWQLLFALALVPVIQGFRAWRFALLASGRMSTHATTMFAIAARLVVLNLILPFKLGELGFPVMMKRAFGTGYTRSAGILLLARLMDLGGVGAILLLCAAWLLDPSAAGWSRTALAAGGIGFLLLPLVVVDAVLPFRRLARRTPRLLGPFDQLTSAVAMVRPLPQRLAAWALTLATWLTHTLVAFLAASALSDRIGPVVAALAGAASNLAFALPVPAIAGLGPPQAVWAAVMNAAGISWEISVATALLCHGVLTVGVVLLGAASLLGRGRRVALPRDAGT